tara:strand:- start:6 stop:356 length:351 start_codon:yes stop_codon:yes gene_type:complete
MSSCPNCGFPLGPHPFDPSQIEEPETNNSNGKTLSHGDTFFFGKYNGRTVEDVLKENPAYILWVNENVEWLTLSNQVLSDANLLKDINSTPPPKWKNRSEYDDTDDDWRRFDDYPA